jgi:ribosomal protein S15P/S13E
MSAVSNPGVADVGSSSANGMANLTTSQKKRIKSYLKRCRMNPRHSQLNLEGYLLLPVQRIPRYRLLVSHILSLILIKLTLRKLEELLRSTPPSNGYIEDPLDKALAEISSLANNMNEGKRESESRRKLVQWQSRIRGRFPSPLVQPHRSVLFVPTICIILRCLQSPYHGWTSAADSSSPQSNGVI